MTTLTERRLAKVAELGAMDPQQARLLGLGRVGYRTLIRWEQGRRRFGLIGCADDRWLRESGGHPSVSEAVREAIFAVRQETLHRSRVSMRTKDRMIRQYVREVLDLDPEKDAPSYRTLCRVWKEWFGPGGSRQRYARSAELPEKNGHVVVHRPGQVVALDTTVLPVMVRESVFGEPVKAHLTLAMDVHTHSLCAFRLTLVSDTSVDVAMLLRDVMLPLPMRDEWCQDLEWPYPGLPAAVVAEFAGHKVAGLPFFAPETVTTDHGSVYRNHHLVEVERVLGCNILPARVLRPTDKQTVERAFGSIRSLLFEQLPGYTGIDAADRGADPEGDAVLTIDAMEHLIATWIVSVWQRRRLGEYAPSWDPGGDHSPNTLFAASFAQAGFGMDIPSPELFYELLPTHYVSIHPRRGVKIRDLWYDGPALEDYRGQRSSRGGRQRGKWVIRRDPRDRRRVFFQDPITHDWHPLDWTGLPPDGQAPAFGDARVRELMAKVCASGLQPKSDRELLPVLLELVGLRAPVSGWKSLRKAERTEHAREVSQAAAARADRPPDMPPARIPDAAEVGAVVTPLRWSQRVRQAEQSIDAERRHRREQAVRRHRPPWESPRADGTFSSFRRTTNRSRMADRTQDESGIVPFLRSGPPPDRTTWEGWQQWQQQRGTFVPAPRLSMEEYAVLSPRRRALNDLHRTATHVNMGLLETPMSARVTKLMRGRLRNNALNFEPGTRDGLMISGGGFLGKTETACAAAAAFEQLWRDLHRQLLPGPVPGTRDLFVPVAYCRTPVRATPKGLCAAILDFFGAPHPKTLNGMIRQVRDSIRDHHTTALLLDDITRLRLHREDDQDTLDLVRELMDLNVTLVLIGVDIPNSGLIMGGHADPRTGQWVLGSAKAGSSFNPSAATQTERRFDLVDLDPFDYDTAEGMTAFIDHLAGLEDRLRLLRAKDGMLTDGEMPEYLFRRTRGIVGLLKRLIEDGCREAIESGAEELTPKLLATIPIRLGNVADRDPSAGEIPEIPAAESAKSTVKRRRGRNTVFDDRGGRTADA
ncbi:AAA family ATPase [Streptomyces sp. NBC_01006]|uniref:AAA family ATPase n=1 Tax=Streptomyces sp. NBC_01006 TaxID=2903716 RepID=UPI00386436DA